MLLTFPATATDLALDVIFFFFTFDSINDISHPESANNKFYVAGHLNNFYFKHLLQPHHYLVRKKALGSTWPELKQIANYVKLLPVAADVFSTFAKILKNVLAVMGNLQLKEHCVTYSQLVLVFNPNKDSLGAPKDISSYASLTCHYLSQVQK